MNFLLVALLLIGICKHCVTATAKFDYVPLTPSESYTHSDFADDDDPDQYRLFWKLLSNDEIQFEVHCRTTGWVGLGISPNGGMTGSDIIIGWVADGIPNLKDTHATRKGAPILDSEQNVKLIDGAEVNGYTILKFKRKLLTCDKDNDNEIPPGSVFMIFAWNKVDPLCTDWKYHGANRRTKSLLLLSFKDPSSVNVLPPDTVTFDIKMNNVEIKPKETYYYCDLIEIPIVYEKYHMIQFEILVQKATKRFVHHIVAYECDDGFDGTPYIGGRECGSVSMPNEIMAKCMGAIFVGWGVGAQYNYSFPKEAGYPFYPNMKKFVLIEMHYDNPRLETGHFDNSGIRLYATQTLRKYDLGVMTFGVNGNDNSIQIPAQTDRLTLRGVCFPQCFEKFVPQEGIYAVSGFLHTHLAGRSIRTSVIRNGKIIKHLFDSPYYDFNYQYLNDIEPFKLLKGDALLTECTYSTMDRAKFTTFGYGTNDEMCNNFLYYYPRQPGFGICNSGPTDQNIFNFYKSLISDSLLPSVLNSLNLPVSTNVRNIFQALKTFIPTSPGLVKKFKEYYTGLQELQYSCGRGANWIHGVFTPSANDMPIDEVEQKSCDPAKYDIPTC